MRECALTLVILSVFSGCTVVDIGVSNPLPEVRRIAIAPFINLSVEPDIDYSQELLFAGGFSDRRFAQAYYAELQKVPGFEVIPVGVVDQAIHGLQLSLDGPEDYLKLCEAIGADAICVGAVTDFDAYQPRLGMQVQWYALNAPPPPCPTTPHERERAIHDNYRRPPHAKEASHWSIPKGAAPRGAGDVYCDVDGAVVRGQSPKLAQHPSVGPPVRDIDEAGSDEMEIDEQAVQVAPPPLDGPPSVVPKHLEAWSTPAAEEILALYSYTRMFDGRDARLTARLRDYVELSGDLRAGGWEGYLTRSDDFIRFCCHVSITEMLQLHGGETSRRVVFKRRTQR